MHEIEPSSFPKKTKNKTKQKVKDKAGQSLFVIRINRRVN